MASTNWIGGGDPETYKDPYASQVGMNINSLSNSNIGAMGAANAERGIDRRYAQRDEQIQSDPNFGRNAAVSGRLHDMAMSEAGGESANAYVKGAEADQGAKERAAQLGIQEGGLQANINQENYQREQSQTFGNSFVGGLLKDAIGYGAGALLGGGVGALAGAGGKAGGGNGLGNLPKSLSMGNLGGSNIDYITGGLHSSGSFGGDSGGSPMPSVGGGGYGYGSDDRY